MTHQGTLRKSVQKASLEIQLRIIGSEGLDWSLAQLNLESGVGWKMTGPI